jgi:UDP-galactopyranose mutase
LPYRSLVFEHEHIAREYPQSDGEPYYSVPCPESVSMLARYETLACAEPSLVFIGRLAQFRYCNMDQAVASALHAVDQITGRAGTNPRNVR